MINVMDTIFSTFEGATMVRRGNSNFIAVPVGENDEGVMEYYRITVSKLNTKGSEKVAPFDFDAAKDAYAAHLDEVAQKAADRKANRPASKTKVVDEAKEAAKKVRKDAVLAWLVANPGEHTASEIHAALADTAYDGMLVMRTGNDLISLMEDGEISCRKENGKKYWTFGN